MKGKNSIHIRARDYHLWSHKKMRFFDIFFQSAKFLHSLKNPKHFSKGLSFDGLVFFGAKKKPKKVLQNAKLGFFWTWSVGFCKKVQKNDFPTKRSHFRK
jgi:hypothetical protein